MDFDEIMDHMESEHKTHEGICHKFYSAYASWLFLQPPNETQQENDTEGKNQQVKYHRVYHDQECNYTQQKEEPHNNPLHMINHTSMIIPRFDKL
jgi:hypothetical protein